MIIEYPDADGEPTAETGIHVMAMFHLLGALSEYFHAQEQVLVGANQFMYYEEGDPGAVVAPDVYVVFGAPKLPPRRVYKVWEEGKAPDVIFEVTSKSTKRKDVIEVYRLYELLGVREYFLFDPLGEYLRPNPQGYRLHGADYRAIAGAPLVSEVLNMELRVEGQLLRLYDRRTGEKLLTWHEMAEARRTAEARAAAAEREVAQLREELARWRAGE